MNNGRQRRGKAKSASLLGHLFRALRPAPFGVSAHSSTLVPGTAAAVGIKMSNTNNAFRGMDGKDALFKSKAEIKAEKEAAKAAKKLEKSKVGQPLPLGAAAAAVLGSPHAQPVWMLQYAGQRHQTPESALVQRELSGSCPSTPAAVGWQQQCTLSFQWQQQRRAPYLETIPPQTQPCLPCFAELWQRQEPRKVCQPGVSQGL